MTDKPYTDADVERVARSLFDADQRRLVAEHAHVSGVMPGRWSDMLADTRRLYEDRSRAALDALAAAGRLLPTDVETVEQFAAQVMLDGEPVAPYPFPTTRQGAESMVRAHERECALNPGWRGSAKVMRRHQHTTPWVEAQP